MTEVGARMTRRGEWLQKSFQLFTTLTSLQILQSPTNAFHLADTVLVHSHVALAEDKADIALVGNHLDTALAALVEAQLLAVADRAVAPYFDKVAALAHMAPFDSTAERDRVVGMDFVQVVGAARSFDCKQVFLGMERDR